MTSKGRDSKLCKGVQITDEIRKTKCSFHGWLGQGRHSKWRKLAGVSLESLRGPEPLLGWQGWGEPQ